jgi:hypothetical protein
MVQTSQAFASGLDPRNCFFEVEDYAVPLSGWLAQFLVFRLVEPNVCGTYVQV